MFICLYLTVYQHTVVYVLTNVHVFDMISRYAHVDAGARQDWWLLLSERDEEQAVWQRHTRAAGGQAQTAGGADRAGRSGAQTDHRGDTVC